MSIEKLLGVEVSWKNDFNVIDQINFWTGYFIVGTRTTNKVAGLVFRLLR